MTSPSSRETDEALRDAPAAADPPFGAFAPRGWVVALRRAAEALGPRGPARKVRRLVARLAGAGGAEPVDLEVFGGQRVRLRLRDNHCERRVHESDAWWDRPERDFVISASRPADPLVFLDIGANAGLWTLAIRGRLAAEGRRLRAALVEPQPEMLARLRANLAFSGVSADEALVLPWAVSDAPGRVRLASGPTNFGGARIGGTGVEAEARPLLDVVATAGLDRVDAMKIDIEGHEAAALGPFLMEAPPALWPRAIVIESPRGRPDSEALRLLRTRGWVEAGRTKLNVMLRLRD